MSCLATLYRLPARGYDRRRSGLAVDVRVVGRIVPGALGAYDAGAKLIAQVVSPVHHCNSVTHAGQSQGSYISRRTGSYHYDVMPNATLPNPESTEGHGWTA